MHKAVFDIEANGLLHSATKIHCICIYDFTSNRFFAFSKNEIESGLQKLKEYDLLIGHNIQSFDIPLIEKLHPSIKLTREIFDTLIMSKVMFSDRFEHGLGSWGETLKCPKIDYQGGWVEWSKEMEDYCKQDVILNVKVYDHIIRASVPEKAKDLEHKFAAVLEKQMEHGIRFDLNKAVDFKNRLEKELNEKTQAAIAIQPFNKKSEEFTPKKNNSVRGYVSGQTIVREYTVPFNPTSRDQVAEFLQRKHGWVPVDHTETGKAKVNGEILSALNYPEAQTFADLFDVKKLYGQLYSGENAWLKKVARGRIFGKINHNGAVTGRCTHSNPNLAQVPRPVTPNGKEARSLFLPDVGHVLVGADASGLELRNLAHYLFPFDNGAYTRTILEGDIHTKNKVDAGLETRDQAKRFIYAFNYGAGDELLGDIINPEATKIMKKAIGKDARNKFLRNNPAVAYLKQMIEIKIKKRGHLIGLDGRPLPVREGYRGLNVLLQSAGAIVMKKATVLLWEQLDKEGIAFKDAWPVLHVHDEFQISAHPDIAEHVKRVAVQSIRDAGEYFNYKCPLDGEGRIGKNWMETH